MRVADVAIRVHVLVVVVHVAAVHVPVDTQHKKAIKFSIVQLNISALTKLFLVSGPPVVGSRLSMCDESLAT